MQPPCSVAQLRLATNATPLFTITCQQRAIGNRHCTTHIDISPQPCSRARLSDAPPPLCLPTTLCLPATLSVLTRRSLAAKSILLCRLSLRNVAAHADLGHHTQQRDATTTATRPHPSCPTRLPENVDHFNIEPYPCSSNMAPPSYVASALLICR